MNFLLNKNQGHANFKIKSRGVMQSMNSRGRFPEVLAMSFFSKHFTHLLISSCVKIGTKISNSQIVFRVNTEYMQRSCSVASGDLTKIR